LFKIEHGRIRTGLLQTRDRLPAVREDAPAKLIAFMSRSTLIILRVLAVGGAVTVLACQVINKQQQANAGAAGDRGNTGVNSPPPPGSTFISGTKSLHTVHFSSVPDRPAEDESSVQTGGERAAAASTASPGKEVRFLGTKSAEVVSPLDVQNLLPAPLEGQRPPANSPPPVVPANSPSRFHGTKSFRAITPEDLRKILPQQRVAPAQQSAPAQP